MLALDTVPERGLSPLTGRPKRPLSGLLPTGMAIVGSLRGQRDPTSNMDVSPHSLFFVDWDSTVSLRIWFPHMLLLWLEIPGRARLWAVHREGAELLLWPPGSAPLFQQIAFKNLVQRNRQAEQQAHRPPPPNSVIHLPFIIVNTSRKTVIDCSISNDKCVTSSLAGAPRAQLLVGEEGLRGELCHQDSLQGWVPLRPGMQLPGWSRPAICRIT